MSTVYMTIGYSGSGKSTFARNFIKDKPKVKIVSPDGFRTMFNGGYKYLPELDDVITKCTFVAAQKLLWAGYDVIIDCGNLTRASDRRGKWRYLSGGDMTHYEYRPPKFVAFVMPMDRPAEWYVERRMKNPHWQNAGWLNIVKNEMLAYEPPTLDEFDEIIHVSETGEITE